MANAAQAAPGAVPAPPPGSKRTEHHDNFVTRIAGLLGHPLGDLLGKPASAAPAGAAAGKAALAGAAVAGTLGAGVSGTVTAHVGMGAPLNLGAGVAKDLRALGRGAHNLWAGAETAGLDVRSGATKAAGFVLHKDFSGTLAADDKARARIAKGADADSFAFKAGRIGTHVVVDTAATVAVAAGGEFLLGAAGLGAAATGAAASFGLGEAAAGVAGRLVLKAAASAVGSGAATAAQGGSLADVGKSALVGGLSVGVGHAVGEAVSPLARAAAGQVAQAAPKLAGASGKLVQVGAEAVSGGATGGLVSAATGGKPRDIVQNAVFGGALGGVHAMLPGGWPRGAGAGPEGPQGGQELPGTIKPPGSKEALDFANANNVWLPGSATRQEALDWAQTPGQGYKAVVTLNRSGSDAKPAKALVKDYGGFGRGDLKLYDPEGNPLPQAAKVPLWTRIGGPVLNSTSLVKGGPAWDMIGNALKRNGVEGVAPESVQVLREYPNQRGGVPGEDSFFVMAKQGHEPGLAPGVEQAIRGNRPPELRDLPVTLRPSPQDGPQGSLRPDFSTVASALGMKLSAKTIGFGAKMAGVLHGFAPGSREPGLDKPRLQRWGEYALPYGAMDKSLLNPSPQKPLVVPQAMMDEEFGPGSDNHAELQAQLHGAVKRDVRAQAASGAAASGAVSGVTDVLALEARKSGALYKTVGSAPVAQPYTVSYKVENGTVTATVKSVAEISDVYDWKAASDRRQPSVGVPAVAGLALTPEYRDTFIAKDATSEGWSKEQSELDGSRKVELFSHALFSTFAEHGVHQSFHTVGATGLNEQRITFSLDEALDGAPPTGKKP